MNIMLYRKIIIRKIQNREFSTIDVQLSYRKKENDKERKMELVDNLNHIKTRI
jgi:hypothetical protein